MQVLDEFKLNDQVRVIVFTGGLSTDQTVGRVIGISERGFTIQNQDGVYNFSWKISGIVFIT